MTSQFYRWFIASKGVFLEHKGFGKFDRFVRYITRWLLFKKFIYRFELFHTKGFYSLVELYQQVLLHIAKPFGYKTSSFAG